MNRIIQKSGKPFGNPQLGDLGCGRLFYFGPATTHQGLYMIIGCPSQTGVKYVRLSDGKVYECNPNAAVVAIPEGTEYTLVAG